MAKELYTCIVFLKDGTPLKYRNVKMPTKLLTWCKLNFPDKVDHLNIYRKDGTFKEQLKD